MRVLILFLLLLAAGVVTSMAAPIGATVIHQEGSASVFSTAVGKRLPLRMGDRIAEGDRIRTGRNGNVEIEFDTGSVIKIDAGTDLVVKSLRRDNKGSTFSIFGLLFGRVKSAVRKLVSSESRFEYQTKAVVAGVAGTPPWVITVLPNGAAEVDLLGAKGDKGAVFVQGLDPQKTLINLTPGTGTRIFTGAPPAPPTPISPARFQKLNQGLPFVARPRLNAATEGKMTTEEALADPTAGQPEAKEEESGQEPEQNGDEPKNEKEPERKQEPEQPGDKAGGASGDGDQGAPAGEAEKPVVPKTPRRPQGAAVDMAVNGIQRVISTPVLTGPDKVNTATGTENTGAGSQGTVGQDAKGGGDNTPPPQTKTIKIQIDLK